MWNYPPSRTAKVARRNGAQRIIITHDDTRPNRTAAEMLAEIAALQLEGASNRFSGREHDSILYARKLIT